MCIHNISVRRRNCSAVVQFNLTTTHESILIICYPFRTVAGRVDCGRLASTNTSISALNYDYRTESSLISGTHVFHSQFSGPMFNVSITSHRFLLPTLSRIAILLTGPNEQTENQQRHRHVTKPEPTSDGKTDPLGRNANQLTLL